MTTHPEDYTIAPEDADLAHEISTFDPVADAPSPVQVKGDFHVPAALKAASLPPHLRDPILAAVAAAPLHAREDVERRMVNEALNQNSYALRVKAGLGEGANAYQREAFSIVREMYELETEELRIRSQLAEVDHWATEYDTNGTPVPVAVERIQGHQRKAMEHRLSQIEHHLNQLQGPEGERRRAIALKQSVEETKRAREALAERAEVKRMAEQMVRDERIRKQAEAHARFLGGPKL